MAATQEIIIRKRRFNTAMNDHAIHDSREELFELKKRDVSPSTILFFQTMIETFDELDELNEGDEPKYTEKKLAIVRLEEILCLRLAKDAKYADELRRFRHLVSHNILLRYGDYYKGNLFEMKKKARELGKTRAEARAHAAKSWKVIWEELDEEKQRRVTWHENVKNDIPQPPLEIPTTKLVEELAGLANMSPADASFQIGEYAKRCDIAHSSIDEAIAKNKLSVIAEYITRDRLAIENGILPPDMTHMEVEMKAALDIFQRRFFRTIVTEEDPATGLMEINYYEPSEEYIKNRKMEQEAQEKKDAQETKLKECEDIYKVAKNNTSIEPKVAAARESLEEAYIEREKAKKRLKTAQAEFSSADATFKLQAVKFQKIVD